MEKPRNVPKTKFKKGASNKSLGFRCLDTNPPTVGDEPGETETLLHRHKLSLRYPRYH